MIKYFEEYNEYYTEITKCDFGENKPIPFTNEEFRLLNSKLEGRLETNWILYNNNPIRYKLLYSGWISIFKLPDECYVVISDKIYKCDQFEGLLKCLYNYD